MDGWFSLGIVLIYFWHSFFFFGKRYFIICRWYSSYIKSDDWVACLWCRTGCLFLSHFLMVLLSPCWFDRGFLVSWICFSGCKWDISINRWCFSLFYLLLISGMRDICKITGLLRRNLELGLRICCRGLILHMWVITVGGDIIHVSPVRRCFFLS